jgi:hypothetical protein
MRGDRLRALVVAARPRDPRGREAEEIAVRVLARVAAQGEGVPSRRPRARRVARRPSALAVPLLALFVGLAGGSALRTSPDAPVRPSRDAHEDLLDRALAGDRRAAADLWTLGPRGRALCLVRAREGGPDAESALDLFGRLGGPADGPEAARLSSLHADPRLSAAARHLLASSPGDSGPRELASLLERGGASEAALVDALRSVARNGRPVLALEGLRRGAFAGRPLAAAAAIRLGGASEVEPLLARLPVDVLGGPEIGEGVATGPESVREAVLRRADRGERGAVVLAVAARLPALPARLRSRLSDPLDAGWATTAVATVGGVEGWRTLPLALEGPARSRALRLLREVPGDAASVFAAEAARLGGARARPFLRALAEVGDPGLAHLDRLARAPTTASHAVLAIGRSRATGAAQALERLAARPALARGAIDALALRLRQGDAAAAESLLAIARDGQARVALEALASCGDAARPALADALADPRLRRVAAAAIARAGDPALFGLAPAPSRPTKPFTS